MSKMEGAGKLILPLRRLTVALIQWRSTILFRYYRTRNSKFSTKNPSSTFWLTLVQMSPSCKKYCTNKPVAVNLFGANGATISTFEIRTIAEDLGLRRDFSWSFTIADLTKAIVDADFIHHYDLTSRLSRYSTTQLRSALAEIWSTLISLRCTP